MRKCSGEQSTESMMIRQSHEMRAVSVEGEGVTQPVIRDKPDRVASR
jgi:hypothetical protein